MILDTSVTRGSMDPVGAVHSDHARQREREGCRLMQRPARWVGGGVRQGERGRVFQGVKEDRLRGDILLTGGLLLESGANSSVGDISV